MIHSSSLANCLRDHGHTKTKQNFLGDSKFGNGVWERDAQHGSISPLQMVLQKLCYTAVVSLGWSLTHSLWFLLIQDSPKAK